MAKGGKQPGAGRPKGSVTRPQLRDYFDEKERAEVVALLKKQMHRDPQMLKFVAEQIYGKATQPIAGDPNDRTPIPILCVSGDNSAS